MLKIFLYLTVVAHFAVLIFNLVAIEYLIRFAPWYVSLPLISFLANLICNRWNCPLTMLENYLRRELGLKEIRGFIGAYILRKS